MRRNLNAIHWWFSSVIYTFSGFWEMKSAGRNTRDGAEKPPVPRWPNILPLSVPAKRFRFERRIKTLSQRIMITYRLLIAIEHTLPNWVLVNYRKKSSVQRKIGSFSQVLMRAPTVIEDDAMSQIEDYCLKGRIRSRALCKSYGPSYPVRQ